MLLSVTIILSQDTTRSLFLYFPILEVVLAQLLGVWNLPWQKSTRIWVMSTLCTWHPLNTVSAFQTAHFLFCQLQVERCSWLVKRLNAAARHEIARRSCLSHALMTAWLQSKSNKWSIPDIEARNPRWDHHENNKTPSSGLAEALKMWIERDFFLSVPTRKGNA